MKQIREPPRLSAGVVIAVAAGLALLVATFVPWFHQESSGGITGRGDPSFAPRDSSAWGAFGPAALILAVSAIVPVVHCCRRLSGGGTVLGASLLIAAGAGSTLVIVVGTAVLTVGNSSEVPDGFYLISTPRPGLFMGFGSSVLMLLGGVAEGCRRRCAATTSGG